MVVWFAGQSDSRKQLAIAAASTALLVLPPLAWGALAGDECLAIAAYAFAASFLAAIVSGAVARW